MTGRSNHPFDRTMSAASSSGSARLLFAAHVVGVAALIAMAAYTLRLHCESFGCMGIGVMWVAWAALFGIVALIGVASRVQARKVSARLATLATSVNVVQWVVGALAALRWLVG